jgi:hypothetical protein
MLTIKKYTIMKNQNLKDNLRTLFIASAVLFFSACSQNSTDHDANTYSNGNPIGDS